MRVMGIDPGYDRLGIAILERNGTREQLLYSECFVTDRTSSLSDRLLCLGQRLEELVASYAPDCVALETLFFNKNQKTAMAVAEARGIATFVARKAGCPVYEFTPQEVKIAITGYGKSDKAAFVSMLTRLLEQIPPSALDDEYDAIAIGVTCLAHHR